MNPQTQGDQHQYSHRDRHGSSRFSARHGHRLFHRLHDHEFFLAEPAAPVPPRMGRFHSKVFEQFGQVVVIIFSEGMKGQVLLKMIPQPAGEKSQGIAWFVDPTTSSGKPGANWFSNNTRARRLSKSGIFGQNTLHIKLNQSVL